MPQSKRAKEIAIGHGKIQNHIAMVDRPHELIQTNNNKQTEMKLSIHYFLISINKWIFELTRK